MTWLLCRNRVDDFARWKAVFDSHAAAHRDSGLQLENLRRGVDEPDNVFFLFTVTDLGKARAFLDAPDASDAAGRSGVVDAEYHFLAADDAY